LVACSAEKADSSRGRVSVALDAAPRTRSVAINGQPCRVWEKGQGTPLVFLAGFGGLPRWTECLDRLAARRRVIAPSLPGFPGTTEIGPLYTHLDWLLATRDLIAGGGLERCDLMGVSLGGALAGDVAAVWPGLVDRLILVSPLGLFDEKEPSADLFAQRPDQLPQLLCTDPQRYLAHIAAPEGVDPVEWMVATTRAREAAARFLWPLGDTGLASRLHRIKQETLLVWGAGDRVVPVSYRAKFAAGISGTTRVEVVEGAGHLVDVDIPAQMVDRLEAFLERRD
jgi:pimeloyl-ACP methyl ester carboxylesterase